MLLAALGTVALTLTVSSCAPDVPPATPAQASPLDSSPQLEAVPVGVKYLADVFGHEEALLAAGKRRDMNVLRDLGCEDDELARHLADRLGTTFEAATRDEALTCPENDWCQNVAGVPLYVPTLVGFSGDRATLTVNVYDPETSNPHHRFLRLERTSEGWVVTSMAILSMVREPS